MCDGFLSINEWAQTTWVAFVTIVSIAPSATYIICSISGWLFFTWITHELSKKFHTAGIQPRDQIWQMWMVRELLWLARGDVLHQITSYCVWIYSNFLQLFFLLTFCWPLLKRSRSRFARMTSQPGWDSSLMQEPYHQVYIILLKI